ncbi:type-F conjugative transfer system pilin assembly protein TrbC [Sandaracinobacter sp. RS1-74]|uniref:type-F conjugative transfer system pilin assembly protein TrbC n=1 Tax=Sandaracinobacteroides sayramensis TaxID=2913411 RepID=UPI001EDAD84F|nr:type-F conjugative transfer system pilin assembly protein TrbC [Sandaracinobacteroides sayramensis]MCG2841305.1 type-F conjugative transfer system pilin assembly protein TrbC [Sandaracinobacteroides sayramensis]
MPTCRPSKTSARVSLALTGLLLLSASALAQDSARDRTAAEGDAALDRLKDAAAARKQEAGARGPTALPTPSEETRRRAFEGLRKRASSPVMDDRARAALQKGKDGLAAERDAMAKRLGQALGLEAPDMAAVAGVAAPPAKGWVPVLFVSSSMPITTLRTYAAQLERVGGILAFRGMPGGLTKVGPMAKLSAEILRHDPGCEGPACAMRDVQLIVDPLIFRQHGVSRVPALALVPGDPALPYCEREDDSPRAAHVIYGDAALSGLLEEYARLGGKEEVRDAQARLQGR